MCNQPSTVQLSSVTHPSVQGSAAPLVFGVRPGPLLQQQVDTVCMATQDSQHQRSPEDDHTVIYITTSTIKPPSRRNVRFCKSSVNSLNGIPDSGSILKINRIIDVPTKDNVSKASWQAVRNGETTYCSCVSVMLVRSASSPLSTSMCRHSVWPLAAYMK